MSRPSARAALVLSLALLPGLGAPGTASPASSSGDSVNFELVGHDPLFGRGMNASPAIFEDFLYVGNRTDGAPHHPHAGVLVVDISDPAGPAVVGEIGPPFAGNSGETSRELRVWPEEELLIVLNFACSAIANACASGAELGLGVPSTIKFFDLSEDPANPAFVGTYSPSRVPREFFLWMDPSRAGRALLFMSTPTASTTDPNLIVTDISRAREGVFTEVASFTANDGFSPQAREDQDVRVNSIGVSADGSRTYLAHLGGGFLVLDSSEIATAEPEPNLRLLTSPDDSPEWHNQTVHSAAKVPGRDLVLTTDEVYGDMYDPFTEPQNDSGCPWGWARVVDVGDETHPRVVGEYRIAQNEEGFCESGEGGLDPETAMFRSYSPRNPTVVGGVAFVPWHAGGLQAIRLSPAHDPSQTGVFMPEPLGLVYTEDPALSFGGNRATKIVVWSSPIIKDGLIYVVDLRNGLFILEYTGPQSGLVSKIGFLEGNSNLGDAVRLGP